ncbi:TetR/AcrR family transcriptional regulator [Roseovarius atlanticus]|uniref:TetR/AcrR family transcriptional regulator n=1 Tax=Roseovarius atlanticus TaxID=1641875 RepID=UPI001C9700CB|nr:TetR/AcrR family transcriptional regulator [Roseovarius atlanticus]MBY5986945.1 TetR/AcrR family transcriptional regulator [Roseovarius atlanticus]MBY6125585.1 TetR/AcrR family transcriptional regulator [Roseovarius atlanticus]MBY6149954.1 TetR/AcrR family transcriptional regulator [Roseovarius atlanticus]
MAGKVETRREALRKTLIDLAEAKVTQGGLAAVKARELAREAGCALGAIYNVFGDLHDIVIAVNGRTFGRLGQAVEASLKDRAQDSPTARMIAMSHAYLDFAEGNRNAWRALFEVQSVEGVEAPDWYHDEMKRLFGLIETPVRDCFPEMPEDDVVLMARALFSSVHGIVALGLDNQVSEVSRADMTRMIALVIGYVTGNR